MAEKDGPVSHIGKAVASIAQKERAVDLPAQLGGDGKDGAVILRGRELPLGEAAGDLQIGDHPIELAQEGGVPLDPGGLGAGEKNGGIVGGDILQGLGGDGNHHYDGPGMAELIPLFGEEFGGEVKLQLHIGSPQNDLGVIQ